MQKSTVVDRAFPIVILNAVVVILNAVKNLKKENPLLTLRMKYFKMGKWY